MRPAIRGGSEEMRPRASSGTEPRYRVMASCTDQEVDYYVDTIAAVVQAEIGL